MMCSHGGAAATQTDATRGGVDGAAPGSVGGSVPDDANPVPTLTPKPGHAVAARYGDATWDLSAVIHRRCARYAIFKWARARTPHLARLAKAVVYAKVNAPAEGDSRWKLATANKWLRCGFGRFADFLVAAGIERIESLTPEILDAYVATVNAEPVHVVVRAMAIHVPWLLFLYGDRLPGDRFGFEPHRGLRRRDLVTAIPRPGEENATPRVPEAIMSPYLAWALRYVDMYAPEIEAAVVEHRLLIDTDRARFRHTGGPRVTEEARRSALVTYLEGLRRDGRGLPGDGRPSSERWAHFKSLTSVGPLVGVSLSRISRGAFGGTECSSRWLASRQHLLHPWRAELGLERERTARERPESLAALLGRDLGGSQLARELMMLRTACYVVIVYLSGMRDSEATSLRPGCVETTHNADGSARRHRVHGLLFKHRDEQGESATWVVIEPVVRAVRAMERLNALFGARPETPLLSGVNFHSPNVARAVSGDHRIAMNLFRKNVCALAAAAPAGADVPPAVPDADGRPWHFTANQLRRTLAWYIVNQPFGTVAGAWQYKHARIAIFEGYGGERAYGFRDEVKREEMRRSMNVARELYDDRKAGRRSGFGGGTAAFDRELDAIRDALGDGPGAAVEVDEARLLKRLRHVAIHLHAGLLNDCWYREELARCKPWQEQPGRPSFARCQPHLCANARFGREHRPAWQGGYENADALLRDRRRLPVNQALVLEADRERYGQTLLLFDRLIEDGDV